jgi:hypothetical protein
LARKKKSDSSRGSSDYDSSFEVVDQTEVVKTKYRAVLAYLIDRDEVNSLIEASTCEYIDVPGTVSDADYPTYLEDEVASLIEGGYHPRKLKKKSKT